MEARRFIVEDPANLIGPPIYSWEGTGSSAWWHCRLCGANATDGHIDSHRHKKYRLDFFKHPDSWRQHLFSQGEAKFKPASPQTTLEPQLPRTQQPAQPVIADQPANEPRATAAANAAAGNHTQQGNGTQDTPHALRDALAAVCNDVAKLRMEVQTLRNEMMILRRKQ